MTKIFYNPKCSKCREALEILKDKGENPEVVEYLKSPPTHEELTRVLGLLKLRPKDILRQKEPIFAELKLDLEDDAAVLDALVRHPALMERPIVVKDGKAVVARPAELVEKIL